MIIMRISLAITCLALLTSCSQDASGQKGAKNLSSTIDSVSYGFGVQIGESMHRANMDSLNVDAMAMGIRHGMDSTAIMTPEQIDAVLNVYKIEAQRRIIAQKQAEGEKNLRDGEAFLTENGKRTGVVTTNTGLQYEVLVEGKGAKPTVADRIKVNYTGTLINGQVFDGTQGAAPAVFQIEGQNGGVIEGWKEALLMMPVGSKWKLYIPSSLAYGASQGPGGNLPPHSTLIFEVELLDILPAPPGQ